MFPIKKKLFFVSYLICFQSMFSIYILPGSMRSLLSNLKIWTDSAVCRFLFLNLANMAVHGYLFQNSDQFGGPWIPASLFKNSYQIGGPWIPAFLFKNSDQLGIPLISVFQFKNTDLFGGPWIPGRLYIVYMFFILMMTSVNLTV